MHLLNQPVRVYPLREVNEPAVYVVGDRAGQKVYPGQTQAQQQIASITSHNANMARLEQRRTRDKRESLVSCPTFFAVVLLTLIPLQPPPQYATDDDGKHFRACRSFERDFLDKLIPLCQIEDSYVTNRSLALTRFTRNHDNLAEIFSPVSICGCQNPLFIACSSLLMICQMIAQLPPPPSRDAGFTVQALEAELVRIVVCRVYCICKATDRGVFQM
jgi:hypothetical protein